MDFGFASVKNLNISENEPLLTGAQTVLIGDQTYQSSDLSMDDQAVITVPKEASFSDVDSQIMTDIPADAPVGAAAYLQYTYNDRKIGGVYLISASLKATEEAAASSVDGTGIEKDGQEHGTVTDSVQPSGSDKTVSKSNPENKNVSGGVPLKIAGSSASCCCCRGSRRCSCLFPAEEEKTGSGCGCSQKRTSFKTSSGNRLQPGRV